VWPIVLFVILLVLVVVIAGFVACAALIGSTAKSVDDNAKKVRSVTYVAESTGRTITVSYNTSTASGVSTATAGSVKSGWSTQVDIAGFAGPNMTVSLDSTLAARQKAGTVTCRILAAGKVVAENKATGEFATATCSATMQDVDRVAGSGG
jgi:hypothetical protein